MPRYEYSDDDALMHYGVLGMKWGVRKDGAKQGTKGWKKAVEKKGPARKVRTPETNPRLFAAEKKVQQRIDRKYAKKAARSEAKVEKKAVQAERKAAGGRIKAAMDKRIDMAQKGNQKLIDGTASTTQKALYTLFNSGKVVIRGGIKNAAIRDFETNEKYRESIANGMSKLQKMEALMALSHVELMRAYK